MQGVPVEIASDVCDIAGAGEAARPVAGASEADAAAASATQAESAPKGTSEAEKLFGAEIAQPPMRQKKVARKSGGGAWPDLPSGAEREPNGLGGIPEEAPPGVLPPGAAQPVTQAPAKDDKVAAGNGIVRPHQGSVLSPVHRQFCCNAASYDIMGKSTIRVGSAALEPWSCAIQMVHRSLS